MRHPDREAKALRRPLVLAITGWAVLATLVALDWHERPPWSGEGATVEHTETWLGRSPRPESLELRLGTFDELPGWRADALAEARPALRRSCARFAFRGAQAEVRPVEVGGQVDSWLAYCQALSELPRAATDADLRELLERELVPVRLLDGHLGVGLFTGYYEPFLDGSRRRTARYDTPLYRNPGGLIQVDLGAFRETLSGQRIAGVLRSGRLEPFPDRSQINAGALEGRNLELVWVDDAVDAFFLHIQGSGRVRLEEGGEMRVGYAGQNGRAYTAIGRELIATGEIPRAQMSMQAIRRWLDENPEQRQRLMETNASFVFFRELDGEGPIGSQGVALTPQRSLAVDRRFVPLGTPVWLDGTAPAPLDASSTETPSDVTIRRLLVAQDTGGAIRGVVRGDVFWGHGAFAADVAGRMKHRGRLWLLLPRKLAETAVSRYPVAERGTVPDGG